MENLTRSNRHENDEKRLKALEYICNEGCGYLSVLTDKIGEEYANELIAVGFVTCGFSPNGKTWKVTGMARDFLQEIR